MAEARLDSAKSIDDGLSPAERFMATIDLARAVEAVKAAVEVLRGPALAGDETAQEALKAIEKALQDDPPIVEQLARENEEEARRG